MPRSVSVVLIHHERKRHVDAPRSHGVVTKPMAKI